MVAPLIARTIIRKAAMRQRRIRRVQRSARRIQARLSAQEAVETPHFPTIIFLMALTKDLLDFTVFISFISTPLIGGILLLWRFNKSQYIQKSTSGWFFKRYLLTVVLEVLTFGILPASSFLVWMTHRKEVAVARNRNEGDIMPEGVQIA